jgi:hypothetical protein
MPKKYKPKVSNAKPAPSNYYDMKDSVDKNKKVKHNEVFGKGTGNSKKTIPNKTKKKTDKKKSSY